MFQAGSAQTPLMRMDCEPVQAGEGAQGLQDAVLHQAGAMQAQILQGTQPQSASWQAKTSPILHAGANAGPAASCPKQLTCVKA